MLLPILKRMFDKSAPLFRALEKINGSVLGYYESADDSLKKLANIPIETDIEIILSSKLETAKEEGRQSTQEAIPWELFAKLHHQHKLFQENYQAFKSYLQDAAEALEEDDPTDNPPPET